MPRIAERYSVSLYLPANVRVINTLILIIASIAVPHVLLLGLIASVSLGLMGLRGITLLFASGSRDLFFFPLVVSIPLALTFGMIMTYAIGRLLGFYGLSTLGDYESRRYASREVLERPEDRVAVPEAIIEY